MTECILASLLTLGNNALAYVPAHGLGDAIAGLFLPSEYLCTHLDLFVLAFSSE